MIADEYKYGLTDAQVQESRRLHGENVLTPPKRKSVLSLLLEKFNDPLIRILLVALALSVGISCYEIFALGSGISVLLEPTGIFMAIMLATIVGFIVELNANKKFNLLNQVSDDVAVNVIREGKITQVMRREIVVGDVVILDTGEEIPADGVLIDSLQLSVNESSLTGEPIAHKTHKPIEAKEETTYAANAVLRGTMVVEGRGVMLVERVGDETEHGKVFTESQMINEVETPLMRQLKKLGNTIAYFSYVVAALIIVGRTVTFFITNHFVISDPGFLLLPFVEYTITTVMLAVTLIVVSVPEGLPMSVTLSLALSMRRMLISNNLVRKMHACETMGAVTVICTDKTGTLTKNQMQVASAEFFALDKESKLLDTEKGRVVAEALACNSTAHIDFGRTDKLCALGNPTDGALILWLQTNGCNYLDVRNSNLIETQLPFSTERKYMATVVMSTTLGKRVLYVKGASEILFNYCSAVEAEIEQTDVMKRLASYQSKAMRTLGFAYKVLNDDEVPIVDGKLNVSGLTFMGIVAISDPVREDVPQAIKECLNAGIEVKIVTGDTPGTAREIGRQVGIWNDSCGEEALISGPEFAALSDDEASERAKQIKIMSRARPGDKARLVRLLQNKGEVVAVTGDGTNDAPALNAAQVGLSMGDGTAVAKEASDITIIDNSFSSINKAVLWGRSLYLNIQRFIVFQLSINVAACLIVGVGSFVSTEPWLTVTQMLWINLIMDTLAALALASLPVSKSVMKKKPRNQNASIITPKMWTYISLVGGIVIGCFMVILYLYFHDKALTELFAMLIVFQIWNMLNVKTLGSNSSVLHKLGDNKVFFIVVAIIILGQVLIINYGGEMFNITPNSFENFDALSWVVFFGFPALILVVGELYRGLVRLRKNV